MPRGDFELSFVLVRGPASLDRRLHVRLPCDGTPITVGRAAHCTTLLDPSLLFSSQVQCSLFAMPAKTATATPVPPAESSTTALTPSCTTDPLHGEATPTVAMAAAAAASGGSALDTYAFTPAQQTSRANAPFTVYITDMCSSNGTFVNGLRISGTDPTELQQGDVCIFGGMRDVEVGETLPADAYTGPELVLWRVDMGVPKENGFHDFDFTATPLVLPARDVLAAEVRALMETAQRSLPKPRRGVDESLSVTPAAQRAVGSRASAATTTTTTSAAGRSSILAGAEGHEDSPHNVQQQLFTSPPPRDVGANDGEQREDTAELSADDPRTGVQTRHSVSLGTSTPGAEANVQSVASAHDDGDTSAPVPSTPPAAVYYTAVRLGNVTFTAAALEAATAATTTDQIKEVSPDGPEVKRARTESAAVGDAAPIAADKLNAEQAEWLPRLTCADTHIKWTMPNPNDLLKQQQQQQLSGSNGGAVIATDDLVRQAGRKPFFGMLAVTSLSTVLICEERRGLAVELRDGCQLPLVDEAVITGSAESRWVVWTLSADMTEAAAAGMAVDARRGGHSSHQATSAKKKEAGRNGRKTAATATATAADAAEVAKAQTPEARFEAWVRRFELFYRCRGVPAPHQVDAATFDLIFAPPVSPLLSDYAKQSKR